MKNPIDQKVEKASKVFSTSLYIGKLLNVFLYILLIGGIAGNIYLVSWIPKVNKNFELLIGLIILILIGCYIVWYFIKKNNQRIKNLEISNSEL